MKQLLGIKHILGIALLLSFLCVFALSCAKDDATHVDTRPQGDGVVVHLNIQSPTDVSTRSDASEDELKIKRGYIFVFDDNGNQIAYEELNIDKMSHNGTKGPQIYSIVLGAPIVKGKRAVFILNQKNDFLSEETLEKINYDDIDATFPLGGALTSGFVDIANQGLPMYGEVPLWDATSSSPITIKRSVARLIVQLNAKVANTGGYGAGFTTANTSYGIFNHAVSGHIRHPEAGIAINSSHSNKAPVSSILDGELTQKPVLVGTTVGTNVVNYLYEYSYTTNIIGENESKLVENSGGTIYPDRFAIILKVGGSPARYYRLDLAHQDAVTGAITYLDLQRNYSYEVIITNINDGGYSSADLAIKSGPSNVKYEIISDDDSWKTISNGSYAISIGGEPFAANNNATPIPAGVNTAIDDVATDVRYILNAGLTGYAPSPNTITVLKTDKDGNSSNAITGATVTVTGGDATLAATLTNTNQNLTVNLPANNTPGLAYYKLKYVLGNLEYISAPITINITARVASTKR